MRNLIQIYREQNLTIEDSKRVALAGASVENIFHITNRAQNREKFHAPIDETWEITCDWLNYIQMVYEIKIHTCLLMPNHIHMQISETKPNSSQAMRYFFTETSRSINHLSSRINHTWGRRHHRSPILGYQYYLHAYKYIYRNPVAAKIVERVEDYKYSTLAGLIGMVPARLHVQDDIIFNEGLVSTLNWLNHAPSEKDIESLKKAFRRKVFQLPKIDSRPNPLEYKML